LKMKMNSNDANNIHMYDTQSYKIMRKRYNDDIRAIFNNYGEMIINGNKCQQ